MHLMHHAQQSVVPMHENDEDPGARMVQQLEIPYAPAFANGRHVWCGTASSGARGDDATDASRRHDLLKVISAGNKSQTAEGRVHLRVRRVPVQGSMCEVDGFPRSRMCFEVMLQQAVRHSCSFLDDHQLNACNRLCSLHVCVRLFRVPHVHAVLQATRECHAPDIARHPTAVRAPGSRILAVALPRTPEEVPPQQRLATAT